MIKLSANHTMVLDQHGTARTFDLEDVLTDLRRCFRECGVAEPWIADHIALVVEEQLSAARGNNGALLNDRDVHAMVTALLCASGYDDVAQHYRRSRQLPLTNPRARELRPWDRQRIREAVQAVLPVHAAELQHLVRSVADALHTLGLQRASTDLIEQLALHLLSQTPGTPRCAPESAEKPWLFTASDWPVDPDDEAVADALQRGILSPYPISRVLPRARLGLDLLAVARRAGAPPLTELLLLPCVHRAATAAARLLSQMAQHLRTAQKTGDALEPRLIVTGLDTTVTDLVVPQCAKAGQRLRRELMDIAQSHLERYTSGNALITFR